MDIQIFQTNAKLRGLLLILIFTFIASGIALSVLAQIQSYNREQIYLATESTLPRHKVASSVSSPRDGEGQGEVDIKDWKTYKNEKYGYEFKYPDNWEIVFDNDANAEDSQTVTLLNSGNAGERRGWDVTILAGADKNDSSATFPGNKILFKTNGSQYVKIDVNSKYGELVDQIINSFKFNTQNINSANWKT